MNTPIPLLLHGATGRMGSSLLALLSAHPGFELVAACSRQPRLLAIEPGRTLQSIDLADAPDFALLVDFSLPGGFDAALAKALQRGAAFLSGTTGLDAAQQAGLDAAARHIPVLWSANFSLGVAVLADLVSRAALALPGWDLDIIDSHHARKQDAPSGTALALGERAKAHGASPRYASLRAGDIVGEHHLQFTAAGERLELVHRASDRAIFAKGALEVAAWLAGRPPGRYTMADWVAARAGGAQPGPIESRLA